MYVGLKLHVPSLLSTTNLNRHSEQNRYTVLYLVHDLMGERQTTTPICHDTVKKMDTYTLYVVDTKACSVYEH